ncbi:unnamed protein product [Chrysoparadoxa australica]
MESIASSLSTSWYLIALLPGEDLANLASCSLQLRESILGAVASYSHDLSLGVEAVRVECVPVKPSCPLYAALPAPFTYKKCQEREGGEFQGCNCKEGPCRGNTSCSCVELNALAGGTDEGPQMFECHQDCTCCNKLCGRRDTQAQPMLRVVVTHFGPKGWGAFCKDKIKKGVFVGRYEGEMISQSTAQRLWQQRCTNYILSVCEHVQGRMSCDHLDAGPAGNYARFFNHSCDPNLELVPVRAGRWQPPIVALFAARDIPAEEELCISYSSSSSDAGVRDKGLSSVECHCNGKGCRGFLPRDEIE